MRQNVADELYILTLFEVSCFLSVVGLTLDSWWFSFNAVFTAV